MARLDGDKKREVKRFTSWFLDKSEHLTDNGEVPTMEDIVAWCNTNVGRGDMKLYRTVIQSIVHKLDQPKGDDECK